MRSTIVARLVALASLAIGVPMLLVLAAFATGSLQGSPADGATKGARVDVVLAPKGDQSKLKPTTTVTKAGRVTFIVSNRSDLATGFTKYGLPNIPRAHELVVLKTNLEPDKLPLRTGSGIGPTSVAVEIGRVGQPLIVNPGKTRTITLALTPGKYILICNLPGHYQAGQRTAIRVIS